ncbi:MAG: filamentous hemagglutinin N-terminal domain-containing protein [Paracoccus sp. (in: a-proteobacteria)]|nr:filamentous hemagglutinin N-terminal domain-containing protein [Paracoccus sp. (in: a-proteobacteria)]
MSAISGDRFRGGCPALALLLTTAIAAAQVVPDGSTNTTVTLGQDGAVTVGIAPADRSGVSLNRYERFNVERPGVRLDNRQEAARTIVNEVTSTEVSTIAGPVEVLGQRAHVIVANPNGIVLDGARFVNTGRVAATTGRITLEDRQIAPGIFQRNAVATVSEGRIEIREGGLSGQMDTVDLIAHELKVSGAISNDDRREGAAIRLVAGQSRTEFDSAVLPGNVAANWGRTTADGGSDDPSFLVEITRSGVLRANHIGIEVNGAGAGVRFAGESYAGARGFSLRSDGEIVVDGGKTHATENGAIALSASKVSLERADIAARAVSVQSSDRFESTDSRMVAKGDEDNPGVIYLDAAGDLLDMRGHYTSDSQIALRSGADLSFSGTDIRSEAILSLTAAGMLAAQDSALRSAGHLLGQGQSMRFTGGSRQTEIIAEHGSLILSSNGDLESKGSLLQGGTAADDLTTPDGTLAAGAVTLKAGGRISNHSEDQLSVVFGAAGDVDITAGGDIENLNGRFLANGVVSLTAQGAVLNRIAHSTGERAPTITRESRAGKRIWWTLGLKRERHDRLSYDFGEVLTPDWIALTSGTQGVRVQAGTQILNEGGHIGSDEGDIVLDALVVETASLHSGRLALRRVCVIRCSYEGSGTVLTYGGGIESGRDLQIHATGHVLNEGGVFYAKRDIDIETPLLDTRASNIPVIAYRPGGLYNFWGSRAAWIFLRAQYGQIIADTGQLTVASPAPVRVQGGVLSAGNGIELANGEDQVAPPAMPVIGPADIGLLRSLTGLGR